MTEFWFYVGCVVAIIGWLKYKMKTADLYADWVEGN